MLLGERGAGKTSCLRRLAYELRSQRQHRVEFVDGALVRTPEALLQLITERLVGPERVRVLPDDSLTGLAQRWGGRWEARPSEAAKMLEHLDRLRDELRPDEWTEPDKDAEGPLWDASARTVVLLDAPAPGAAHTLFGRLRDELWTLPLIWVVATGLDDRGTIMKPPADAFFDETVLLRALTDLEAEDLLCRRLGDAAARLPAGVVAAAAREANGSPRSLVAAARRRLQSPQPTADLDARAAARDRAAAALADLGRPAAMLVAELDARGGSATASDAGLLDALGWSRPRAVQVLRQLEDAGLVTTSLERSSGAGRPRKAFHLVDELR